MNDRLNTETGELKHEDTEDKMNSPVDKISLPEVSEKAKQDDSEFKSKAMSKILSKRNNTDSKVS